MATTAGNKTVSDTKVDGDKAVAEKPVAKRDADMPEGFDTRVGREQGKGWLTKTVGSVIQGRLIGRFLMSQTDDDGNYRVFYQVQLSEEAGIYELDAKTGKNKKVSNLKGTAKDPEDKDNTLDIEFVEGDVVNIGEHKALEELSPFTRNGGKYDVWFKYLSQDKIPGKGKRTFWSVKGPILKTLVKPSRRPDPAPSLRPGGDATGAEESDIPF